MVLKPYLKTRAAAAKLINEVLRTDQPFEQLFSKNNDISLMDSRDRAFVQNLSLTTLRHLGQIDALINNYIKRPLPIRSKKVWDILRIGACQILFLDVANHGAVASCVELTRQQGHSSQIKLVNAVLRRLTREGPLLVTNQDEAFVNTPSWLWKDWSTAYGEDQCRKIADAHLRGSVLDLSIVGDPSAWSKKLNGDLLPSGTVRLATKGPITDLPGFHQGSWWVQDLAARLVASLAGDVVGKSIVDLCAAPGGKTAFFASRGGRVIAVDRSESRLLRLHDNLERLRLAAEIIEGDVLIWRPQKRAEIVMLDAPCSATGTARRHPDILWTKTKIDVQKLARLQREMLRAAAEMVAKGGFLIFATCSLQPEESCAHIEPFLTTHPNFKMIPVTIADVFGIDEVIAKSGFMRSLPHHFSKQGGMDGFFAVKFQRQI